MTASELWAILIECARYATLFCDDCGNLVTIIYTGNNGNLYCRKWVNGLWQLIEIADYSGLTGARCAQYTFPGLQRGNDYDS